MQHVGIVGIKAFVYVQHLFVRTVHLRLVEDAQHLLHAVVDLTAQTGYLHDDAVMRQTVDERIRQTLRHDVVIIVVGATANVEHRLLDVTHLMPKKIDRNHRDGIALLALRQYVLRVGIVHAKILTEAKRLRFQPRLLQLYQDKTFGAVRFQDGCAEVYAEDGQVLAIAVRVLIAPHLHVHDIHLQQGRENGLGYAFILHQVFEHYVIYRICYYHLVFLFLLLSGFQLQK